MVKVLVVGGTHLGIKGLYREKIFEVESIDEIEAAIRKQFNLEKAMSDSYMMGGTLVHTLSNDNGETLFEYYIRNI